MYCKLDYFLIMVFDDNVSGWGEAIIAYEPIWAIGTSKVATSHPHQGASDVMDKIVIASETSTQALKSHINSSTAIVAESDALKVENDSYKEEIKVLQLKIVEHKETNLHILALVCYTFLVQEEWGNGEAIQRFLGEGYYEVERIHNKQTLKGKFKYLVKWQGWLEIQTLRNPM
eukprot:Gb_28505 [translate_table: standard]